MRHWIRLDSNLICDKVQKLNKTIEDLAFGGVAGSSRVPGHPHLQKSDIATWDTVSNQDKRTTLTKIKIKWLLVMLKKVILTVEFCTTTTMK